MHEAALAQAALPAPVQILGLALRPYSLGHELFLIREANPLAVSIAGRIGDIKRPDLATAALICCGTWHENRALHRDWLMSLKLAIWKFRPVVRNGLKENFGREVEAFREYQQSGCLEFRHSELIRPGMKTTRIPGAPFLLRLHQFLMTRLGLPESAAWDYPLGLAKMRWQTYWEEEDFYEIYSDHDAEFDRFIAEQEALANA